MEDDFKFGILIVDIAISFIMNVVILQCAYFNVSVLRFINFYYIIKAIARATVQTNANDTKAFAPTSPASNKVMPQVTSGAFETNSKAVPSSNGVGLSYRTIYFSYLIVIVAIILIFPYPQTITV